MGLEGEPTVANPCMFVHLRHEQNVRCLAVAYYVVCAMLGLNEGTMGMRSQEAHLSLRTCEA